MSGAYAAGPLPAAGRGVALGAFAPAFKSAGRGVGARATASHVAEALRHRRALPSLTRFSIREEKRAGVVRRNWLAHTCRMPRLG